MSSASSTQVADVDQDFINKVLAKHTAQQPGSLLAILQEVQNNHPRKYLPQEALGYIAARTGIPMSRIYSVATFYALFNLKPQGRNTVCVCRGTACHTRGSRDLMEKLMMNLGLRSGEDAEEQLSVTTADGKMTVRTVACFGQCALAPVIEVNHSIFGHMNERMMMRELEAIDKQEGRS
jgi:NADH-quinone oxidoreductase subunit E